MISVAKSVSIHLSDLSISIYVEIKVKEYPYLGRGIMVVKGEKHLRAILSSSIIHTIVAYGHCKKTRMTTDGSLLGNPRRKDGGGLIQDQNGN